MRNGDGWFMEFVRSSEDMSYLSLFCGIIRKIYNEPPMSV